LGPASRDRNSRDRSTRVRSTQERSTRKRTTLPSTKVSAADSASGGRCSAGSSSSPFRRRWLQVLCQLVDAASKGSMSSEGLEVLVSLRTTTIARSPIISAFPRTRSPELSTPHLRKSAMCWVSMIRVPAAIGDRLGIVNILDMYRRLHLLACRQESWSTRR
jgi:hypothetical protein